LRRVVVGEDLDATIRSVTTNSSPHGGITIGSSTPRVYGR